MENQTPTILMQRTNKLMNERYLSKKEMAERLGMEYLTFWRKLRGKRGVDVALLVKIAEVLGTSAAYLLGETDDAAPVDTSGTSLLIHTNAPSRKIISEPGRLIFNNGEVSIDIPDTPVNKKWFEDFLQNVLPNKTPYKTPSMATA